MSTATESRKAAVERAIETVTQAVGHNGSFAAIDLISPGGATRPIFAGDLHHLIAAAKAGIAGEGEEEPETAVPRCLFCGGRVAVHTQYTRHGSVCRASCLNPLCKAQGPEECNSSIAIARFTSPPGASKPEPPPSDVAIGRGSIRIEPSGSFPGAARVFACVPECESPAFSKFATADQLDALAALASRVAADVRKAVGR